MSRASEPGRSTGVDVGTVAVAGAGAGAGAGVSGVETSREGAARKEEGPRGVKGGCSCKRARAITRSCDLEYVRCEVMCVK